MKDVFLNSLSGDVFSCAKACVSFKQRAIECSNYRVKKDEGIENPLTTLNFLLFVFWTEMFSVKMIYVLHVDAIWLFGTLINMKAICCLQWPH